MSDQAKFTERVRRVSRDVLEDDMTIEDPATLARPWTVKIRYHPVTDLERMINYDCAENDRNPVVNGKLTVAPPSHLRLPASRYDACLPADAGQC